MSKIHSIKINDQVVFFRTYNQPLAQPIICFHGYADDSSQFADLAMLLPQYYFICPDFPMIHNRKPQSLNTLTNFSLEFVKALNFANFHLLGFSLGGAVAANLYPNLKSKLFSIILLNAPIQLKLSPYQQLIYKIAKPLITYPLFCQYISKILDHSFTRYLLQIPPYSSASAPSNLKRHAYPLYNTLSALISTKPLFDPQTLPSYTLAVYTKDDTIVPLSRYSKDIAHLPYEAVTLDTGGHANLPSYWPQIAALLKSHL